MTLFPDSLFSSAQVAVQLNNAQSEASNHFSGPMVIYAGAGSGKTKTIVSRIANMIASGVHPSAIFAVTFTNKAAKELRERVESQVGMRAKSVLISTFHSACARFLRIYAKEAGYSESFSIFDDDDAKNVLKECIKELEINDKLLSLNTVKSSIDRAKNAGVIAGEYRSYAREQATQKRAQSPSRAFQFQMDAQNDHLIADCFVRYDEKLKKQNAMDFNDLLCVMVKLLKNNSSVLQTLQNRYQYFLVDEFQDTNRIQFELIQLLALKHQNLCIVGDDDQSIYSWRGAEPSFILDFQTYYPQAKIYKLEQNYRSSANIVKVATHIIAHNTKRAPKVLWTDDKSEKLVTVGSFSDAFDEARFVVDRVLSGIAKNESPSEFCLLYRTNAQSRILEDQLRRNMIPYVIFGSVKFYERAEIKTLLSYLKLLVNLDDDACFGRVISVPKRGFGEKALLNLKVAASGAQLSLMRAADRVANGELKCDISRGLSGLRDVAELIIRSRASLELSQKPSLVLQEIIGAIKFEDHLRASHPEDADERILNCLELKNAIEEFEEKIATNDLDLLLDNPAPTTGFGVLSMFLEQAMLVIEPSKVNVRQGESEAVTLMTIHASKGLEFNQVFVCGLEEGVLPHMNSLESEVAIEEERRLLYVAVTRAKKQLTISHIECNRYRSDMPAQPSRFLAEIPEDCVEYVRKGFRGAQQGYSQSGGFGSSRKFQMESTFPGKSKFSSDVFSEDLMHSTQERLGADSGFVVGAKAKHKIFGTGTVLNVEKTVDGFRIEVKFPAVGAKKLLHTYLQPLSPSGELTYE